jgi:hypothetical protein
MGSCVFGVSARWSGFDEVGSRARGARGVGIVGKSTARREWKLPHPARPPPAALVRPPEA